MRSRPNYTVIVLLILLLILLGAMTMPAISFIRDLQQIGPALQDSTQPALTQPSSPVVSDPTLPSTVPVTMPTAPGTEPTSPVTEPTVPATQPSEPVEPVVCEHVYASEVIAATCVEQGYTNYVYSLCGDRYISDYTELGDHSYCDWQLETEPTCTKEGAQVCACQYCGQKQTRTLAAKGHSYGSWKTTKSATCTSKGQKERTCSVCANVETKTIDATGHDYDDGVITKPAASCADTGIKAYTCKKCGETYEATVLGAHDLSCNTCGYYGTGNCDELHEPGIKCDMEHEVGCENCDFGYMDIAYYYLCQGVIDENSALLTDTVKLKDPDYNSVLATWSEQWHEFATFTQMGIMYGSWSAKDGWEGQDYEYRVWDVTSYEQALAILDDYNTFVVEFEKVYYWKPVEVKMEYREEKQYVRLYYTDQDQYNTYRKQKKNVTDAQKEALADEIVGYTLQKWGIRDGMTVSSILEYLYYMIWTDVAYYDQSLRFHTAYDGFATHTCVCDGYSEIFQYYADALGIQSKEVFGRMNGVGHAWNKVILSDGSEWYVDITNGPILETAEAMREMNYTWK